MATEYDNYSFYKGSLKAQYVKTASGSALNCEGALHEDDEHTSDTKEESKHRT